jgi:outer membrane protein TolC
MRKLLVILISIGSHAAWAQDSLPDYLPYDIFIDLVRTNHPVAKQAALRPQTGEANLLKSKGAFDPKLYGQINQKYFDNKQYYSLLDAGIGIPTRIGVDLKAGFEQNQGALLNPENSTPAAGLAYAGVSVSLGQGLLFDERRAALQEAEIYRDATIQEQNMMRNDLLYQASIAYWEWARQWEVRNVYVLALQLSETRLEAIKQSVLLGDRASMDTLEASIQVNNFKLLLQQADIDLNKARLKLGTFTWEDGQIPLELKSDIQPQKLEGIAAPAWMTIPSFQWQTILAEHPELQWYARKKESMEIEQKWLREQFKPQLDISYNPLSEPIGGDVWSGYSVENYTFGITFQMPLFYRKERGALEMNQIKVQDISFTLEQKRIDWQNKFLSYYQEWTVSQEQISLYQRTVGEYNQLLNAEQALFNGGESSIFMINSREQGYIAAQIKLLELQAKNQMAAAGMEWSLGSAAEL